MTVRLILECRGPDSEHSAEDVIVALAAEGWQLVPKEPTEHMLEGGHGEEDREAWRYMIARAPDPLKE